LGAFRGTLAEIWMRISGLKNVHQLRRAATWSATNFVGDTGVPFDTEDIIGNSTISDWTSGTNPNRIDIGYTARYTIAGLSSIDSTGGSTWTVECFWRKNGTTEIPGTRIRTGNYGGGDSSVTMPSMSVDLVDGDYIEWCFNNSFTLAGNLHSATLSIYCEH